MKNRMKLVNEIRSGKNIEKATQFQKPFKNIEKLDK